MRKSHFLLCYDITDSRRLQRLQRLVSKQMLQVQYSMYYATLSKAEMDKLVAKIVKLINIHHDDVRVYMVEPLEQAFLVGKRSEAVMVFGEEGQRILW